MAIRPPRQARRHQPRYQIRDALASSLVMAIMLAFGLRALMAFLGVEPWTAAWEIVALPTDPVISLVTRAEPLARVVTNRLTAGEFLAFVIVVFAGLTYLASLALKRD